MVDVSVWKIRGNEETRAKMWLNSMQILGNRRYYEEQTQTIWVFGILR